jgi:hypothetical protein
LVGFYEFKVIILTFKDDLASMPLQAVFGLFKIIYTITHVHKLHNSRKGICLTAAITHGSPLRLALRAGNEVKPPACHTLAG